MLCYKFVQYNILWGRAFPSSELPIRYLVQNLDVECHGDGAWVGEDVPSRDVLAHLALPPARLVAGRPLHLDGALVLLVVADDEDLAVVDPAPVLHQAAVGVAPAQLACLVPLNHL